MIPKGGRLSATIAVDASNGKLPDSLATSDALNSILAAQRGESVPERFRLETGASSLFVEPQQQHSVNGSLAPAKPILQTPVTLAARELPALKVLDDLLRQVKAGSGVNVTLGMIFLKGFRTTKVTLAASFEPAKYTLAKLLKLVFARSEKEGRPAFYQMLYDPNKQDFVLNVLIPPLAVMKLLPDYTPPQPANPLRLGKPQIPKRSTCGEPTKIKLPRFIPIPQTNRNEPTFFVIIYVVLLYFLGRYFGQVRKRGALVGEPLS